MKKTTGMFYYPPLINEQALYVGGLRDTNNQYLSQVCPEMARPNMQVDQLGCKCEMIAQYFFGHTNINMMQGKCWVEDLSKIMTLK